MKVLVIVLRIMLISGIVLIGTGCTDLDKESNSDVNSTTRELPETESWDAELHVTKEGKRVAIVRAGYIATYSQYKMLNDGVKADFYDEEGNHKSVLTSNQAKVINDTQDMYAIDNVVVVSDDGAKLYTDELIWVNAEQKVISKVPVILKTETETIYGDYFKSDPDLKEYDIVHSRGKTKQTISFDE
jgi:LPS export ABC transporter protein LptC